MNDEKLVSMFGILIDKMEGFEEGQKRLEKRLEERFDRLEERVDRLEEKVDRLEEKVDRLEEKVDRLEEKVDRLEEKVDRLEVEVAQTKSHIIAMENGNKKLFDALFARDDELYRISSAINTRVTELEAAQRKHDTKMLREEVELSVKAL